MIPLPRLKNHGEHCGPPSLLKRLPGQPSAPGDDEDNADNGDNGDASEIFNYQILELNFCWKIVIVIYEKLLK